MADLDDYMSDNILNQCNDIRPGILSKEAARKHRIEHEKYESTLKNRRQKLSTVEHETRQEALTKPLSQDNRGFLMLTKMGYKTGMALGKFKSKEHHVIQTFEGIEGDEKPCCSSKSGSSIDPMIEPIAIDIKFDKKGLGHKALEKERTLARQKARSVIARTQVELRQNFHNRRKERARYYEIYKNLLSAQKACFELDSRRDIIVPYDYWFWPRYALPQEMVEKLDNILDSDEECVSEISQDKQNRSDLDVDKEIDKLNCRITGICEYLKSQYLYCLWCAVSYENVEDLQRNCPGLQQADHEEKTDYDEL